MKEKVKLFCAWRKEKERSRSYTAVGIRANRKQSEWEKKDAATVTTAAVLNFG